MPKNCEKRTIKSRACVPLSCTVYTQLYDINYNISFITIFNTKISLLHGVDQGCTRVFCKADQGYGEILIATMKQMKSSPESSMSRHLPRSSMVGYIGKIWGKKPFIKIFLQVKNNPAYQVCGTDPHGICSLIHTFDGQYILMLQHICAKFGWLRREYF